MLEALTESVDEHGAVRWYQVAAFTNEITRVSAHRVASVHREHRLDTTIAVIRQTHRVSLADVPENVGRPFAPEGPKDVASVVLQGDGVRRVRGRASADAADERRQHCQCGHENQEGAKSAVMESSETGGHPELDVRTAGRISRRAWAVIFLRVGFITTRGARDSLFNPACSLSNRPQDSFWGRSGFFKPLGDPRIRELDANREDSSASGTTSVVGPLDDFVIPEARCDH